MGKESIELELKREVQALEKKLGRTPKKREFEKESSARWHFGSWNNFLKESGLKPLREVGLSKEDYTEIIHNFVKKNNKVPTQKDFITDPYLPDIKTMQKSFDKSWNEILLYLGYEENLIINDFSDLTDVELMNIVKKELVRIGKTTIKSYQDNKKVEAPSVQYLRDRLGLKWNEVLKLINMPINVEYKTKEELLKTLRDLSRELGRTPSIGDIAKKGLNESTYKLNFGSWNGAIKEAGLDVNFPKTRVTNSDKELLDMYIELCKKLRRAATSSEIDEFLSYNSDVFSIRFNGINNLRKLAGYEKINYSRKYTKAEIVSVLTRAYDKYGRRLTNRELREMSKKKESFPSITTICRYFSTTKMSDVWREIEEQC